MLLSTNPLDPTNLPAQLHFYGPFEERNNGVATNCQHDTGESSIQNKLTSCCNDVNALDVDKIKNAFCFVSGLKPYKQYPHYKYRWHFLYYWVGDLIWKSLGEADREGKLPGCLKQICELIQSKCESEGCKLNFPEQMDGDTFEQSKEFFDFIQNYNDINYYLQSGNDQCDEQWSTYKKNIEPACKAVQEYCKKDGEHSTEQYCTEYSDTYEIYCTRMLGRLHCKSQVAEPEDEHTTYFWPDESIPLSIAQANLSKATTTTALSSIIGTLGLTVLPYALYKYKPWSSWFGNHTSGNGRRRTSTRKRRSDEGTFDTFTEDSSTYDSATESIVDDSTTQDSRTLRSATYTAQSTRERERRNNNTRGGHGMVGYQHM
ncbi:KIR-like protein [Plasmodium coatneyi]|uniref:KIR-like protein n=1 Tax=Plasmodium coatneyi TaxID=208452 RepID=A0A1B1E3D5_9APIC|nr:KIR-like protein [Plasmodium coatneyi]ANQ09349.1 KIR-like protein [Plasmodium coatneyi]